MKKFWLTMAFAAWCMLICSLVHDDYLRTIYFQLWMMMFMYAATRHEEVTAESKTDIDDASHSSKWIPCSKRLPREDGDYLVWDSDFGECVDTYYVEDSTEEYGHRTFAGWQSSGSRVVAWMPLHEPFRRDNGEIWLD